MATEALTIAERLRAATNAAFRQLRPDCSATITVGHATVDAVTDSDALVHLADESLYRRKHARSAVAQSGQPRDVGRCQVTARHAGHDVPQIPVMSPVTQIAS